MINIWQRVSQVTALHQWYTQQIDAHNLAAISKATLRSGPNTSPVMEMRQLRTSVQRQIEPMLDSMITEASSDAIVASLRNERFELTPEEADRVELLTDAYRTHLKDVITHQLISDENQANKRYQQFWLRVELAQYRDGISKEAAVIREREETLIGESTRTDSMGRSWKAARYIQVETMSKLTDLFNAIVIYLIGRRGWEEAQVYNPGHANHERKFMISDYMAVESEYFHANSPALITKVIY